MTGLERAEDLSTSPRGPWRTFKIVSLVVEALILVTLVSWYVKKSRSEGCRYVYGQTLGALRTLVFAEEAYAVSNGGFYDVPRCLAAPGTCIPGYPEKSPIFLEEDFWTQGSQCYERTFHPGPRAEIPDGVHARLSPSSLKSYAFTATPAPTYPYDRSKAQRFCTDSSGVICYTSDDSEPVVVDGLCGHPCTVLE